MRYCFNNRMLCCPAALASPYLQAQGLAVCLGVLEAQLHAGPALQEAFASHVLQAITNAAEYGPCNVELQRSPQLQVSHF